MSQDGLQSAAFHWRWWEAAQPGTARCHLTRALQEKPGWKWWLQIPDCSIHGLWSGSCSTPALASCPPRHGPNSGLANKKSCEDRGGLLPLSAHLGVLCWLSNYLGVLSTVKTFAARKGLLFVLQLTANWGSPNVLVRTPFHQTPTRQGEDNYSVVCKK